MTPDDIRDLRSEIGRVRDMAMNAVADLQTHVAACAERHNTLLDNQKRLNTSVDALNSAMNRLFWIIVCMGLLSVGAVKLPEILQFLR